MMSKVVMYGASWCAPCRATKPEFEKVSTGYLSDMGVEFEYKDVDELEPDVLEALRISSVPTIILHQVNPVRIASRTHLRMEQEIEQALISDSDG